MPDSDSVDLSKELEAIVARFAADSGTIHILQRDGFLHLAAVTGGLAESLLEAIKVIPVGKGMAGLAVERGRPVDACNIQTDESGDVRPGARSTGLSGALVVPIFDGDTVVGALGVANRDERVFTQPEIDQLLNAGRGLVSLGFEERQL